MSLKRWLATGCIICLVVMAASAAISAPYKIYDEARLGGSSGNAYYFGGVFDGKAYVGHIGHGAQQWGDQQLNGSGCWNATDNLLPLTPNNVAKSAISLGGWIYMSNGAGNLCRVRNWNDAVAPQELPSPILMSDGNPVYCDCITTDGTYIYVSTGTGAINGPYNTIYKYLVNHEAGTISLVWQSSPAGSTTSSHRFRAISYYNGKLYTSNNKGAAVGHIFEVDCGTGAYTDIATMNPTGAAGDPYQVVRYGNQIFVVSLNDCLYTFDLVGSTWVQQEPPLNLGVGDLYGLAVTGDGTTARYFWASHIGGRVSFWDMYPVFTPGSLGDARKTKNGHPSIVKNAAVTKTVDGVGFWAEDKDRGAGAFVNWTGTMPAVNALVDLQGGMTANAAGEKLFNAMSVTPVGSYTIKPLYLNNKNMANSTTTSGLATDGMLVKVSGKLTNIYVTPEVENPPIFLYIDDGSGVANGIAGTTGLKVTAADMMTVPGFYPDVATSAPAYPYEVTVTGIARFEKLGDGSIIRKIEALTNNDIVFTGITP